MAAREDFTRLTGPYRRELIAHCYRMTGSLDEAEDLVQETYLRAWRSFGRFEGRSSLRTWLYRIATNACLSALEHGRRRVLPAGLPAGEQGDAAWLQPLPDHVAGLGGGSPADPAEVAVTRQSVRLALVAALQYLPPRHRAVLILRDVLGWRAAEVAGLLGTTTAAVNNVLRRARARLAEAGPDPDAIREPAEPGLAAQYAAAFRDADIDALMRLLTSDAVLEMPPLAAWFRGPAAIGRFLSDRVLTGPGVMWLVPAPANGQPGFACYLRHGDGGYRAHAVQVLGPCAAGLGRITIFLDPALFASFGLPPVLAPDLDLVPA
ncbi:MAG TPA: RNA polymerase subunit sigma-70 [Streptosporangiaceae bacterium]|nr:RNA polymerase subunit sigma-70 [Streptosporangiaceae bacterium]